MSEDALELALDYSRGHAAALAAAPGILGDVLGCDICNSLMVEPYTLECGHSFCHSCLHSWTHEREAEATCPTCRQRISAQPHRSLALRQLALAVAASYNADPATTAKVPASALEQRATPEFSVREGGATAIWDSADDVYRCPRCTHEVEETGECPNCGDRWEMPGFNIVHYSDFPDSSDSSHSDLDSFIDDEASESGLDIAVDDDVDLDEDDDDDDDGDDDVAHGGNHDDSDDESMADESDKEAHEAADTSDDSLLEETRQDRDSDVEVTTVVHRPRAIVDDDDDDDDELSD